MLYVRFPLSLRNVEDLLHERGIDICHETVRQWWMRFGPMFAAEIQIQDDHGRELPPGQTGEMFMNAAYGYQVHAEIVGHVQTARAMPT